MFKNLFLITIVFLFCFVSFTCLQVGAYMLYRSVSIKQSQEVHSILPGYLALSRVNLMTAEIPMKPGI